MVKNIASQTGERCQHIRMNYAVCVCVCVCDNNKKMFWENADNLT